MRFLTALILLAASTASANSKPGVIITLNQAQTGVDAIFTAAAAERSSDLKKSIESAQKSVDALRLESNSARGKLMRLARRAEDAYEGGSSPMISHSLRRLDRRLRDLHDAIAIQRTLIQDLSRAVGKDPSLTEPADALHVIAKTLHTSSKSLRTQARLAYFDFARVGYGGEGTTLRELAVAIEGAVDALRGHAKILASKVR